MDSASSEKIVSFLQKQKDHTGCALPHRYHLLVEFINTGPGFSPGNQVVLHTLWGGRVNRPFAMAMDTAWEEKYGHRLEIYSSNDCIVLLLPHEVSGEELLSLVTSSKTESLLRKRLEGSGFFGARFREAAGRALLLTRGRINERMPLWMSRVKSQKLLNSVFKINDFPILIEAWRTCLQDEFDLKSLHQILTELETGAIKWSETRNRQPSPMALNVTWRQINQYMYMGDELGVGKESNLSDTFLREIVYNPGLRPTVDRELVDQFEYKLKRLSPGYSPSDARDLLDWIKERIAISKSEWKSLLEVMARDHATNHEDLSKSLSDKLVKISPPDASSPLIIAWETMPKVILAFYENVSNLNLKNVFSGDVIPISDVDLSAFQEYDREELLTSFLGDWLQFYGPIDTFLVRKTLGIDLDRLLPAINDLIESEKIIKGQLVSNGSYDDICDSENFESLLRISRKASVPATEPLEIDWLPLFLAFYQGMANTDENIDGLYARIEQLLCYSMKAHMWETEILPARMNSYKTAWLDTIMQETDLFWIGGKNQTVSLCFESDLDLMNPENTTQNTDSIEVDHASSAAGVDMEKDNSLENRLFPDPMGRYDFGALLSISQLYPEQLAHKLWEEVWQGKISNDTFLSLRRGIQNKFKVSPIAEHHRKKHKRSRRPGGRSGFSKWKGSLPFLGNWFILPNKKIPDNLLEKEEQNKERVRVLLDRYGILFRELLSKELPYFTWSRIFRSLRLMELSGEVLAGYFFYGIPGPQFMSHEAFRILRDNLPDDSIFWINAADPASLCGIQLEDLKKKLPKRVEGTHLVYKGKTLVMISKRKGKDLTFFIPPDDSELQSFFSPLKHLLSRKFQPLTSITIEKINDEDALSSPYLDPLREAFDVIVDYKYVTLYRREIHTGPTI